jgi:hypothetical protein
VVLLCAHVYIPNPILYNYHFIVDVMSEVFHPFSSNASSATYEDNLPPAVNSVFMIVGYV